MMRLRLAGLLALLIWIAPAGHADAADSLWVGLVLATNTEKPVKSEPPLADLEGKLHGVFGYNQYELIGQNEKATGDLDERWLMPSREFFLSVEAREQSDLGALVEFELYHRKRSLLESTVRLSPKNPLFIRGPLYGQGQLIIVLMLK